MSKAPPSGRKVNKADLPLILGMVARGDRRHDVAAWFGLNQGRIKEVEDGDYGPASKAPQAMLPPSGSPGPKARKLHTATKKALAMISAASPDIKGAVDCMNAAIQEFEKNE